MISRSDEILCELYTSKDILSKDNLFELQDSFSFFGVPFKYEMTEGELRWIDFVIGRYCIADWIVSNLKGNILTFDCPIALKEAIEGDGMDNKAVMLSDDTALQRLFFWLS
jgi:DNA polymerase sigma